MEEETLPNGIYVRRLPGDTLWIASINIGPWHYSQGGETKDLAIQNIFSYMKRLKIDFTNYLRRDIERLHTLHKFLETECVEWVVNEHS